MKKINPLLILIFIFFSSLSVAQNQPKGNIHPNLKLSFTERFRLVTWDNAVSLSDAANAGSSFSRNRMNLQADWFVNENIDMAIKLTNEFRYYFVPQGRDFEINEIFIDQLYFKYKNELGSLTLGRQNIILGEGFVVMDGHPLDGSRSIYFNAARVDWNINKTNSLTLFLTYQPETDDILPRINDQDQKLIEQPETGFGAYFKRNMDPVNLEAYYIYKNIDETDLIPVKSNIHTIGARVQLPVAERLSLTGEGAYQFGDCGEAARAAYGGYVHLDYSTGLKEKYLPNAFTLGTVILSGDDPETEDIEGWDPLFSRWPKWSESYIYTQIREFGGKVAYWSNFATIYASAKFVFSDKLNFNFDYHHMLALEDSAPGSFPGGDGHTRGDLLIAKLNYKIDENVSGHFLWENFTPGNFYFDGADGYNWARIEFMFKI